MVSSIQHLALSHFKCHIDLSICIVGLVYDTYQLQTRSVCCLMFSLAYTGYSGTIHTCKPANHDDGIICLVVTIWDVFLFISDAKWAFEVIKEHREPIQLGIQ